MIAASTRRSRLAGRAALLPLHPCMRAASAALLSSRHALPLTSSTPACSQVLKARGHLLPAELEALASQQRAEDRAVAAAYEGGARVVVQAAARLPSRKLERTRSQQLRAALDQPACREALAGAAAAAAQGRVLAAHAALRQLAAEAGGNLAELAELPPDALAAALPPGASLDVGRVVEEARYVGEALAALEDHRCGPCLRLLACACFAFWRQHPGSGLLGWGGVRCLGRPGLSRGGASQQQGSRTPRPPRLPVCPCAL